jgi:hypothetical protein
MKPIFTNKSNRLSGAASTILLATSLSSSAAIILAQEDFAGGTGVLGGTTANVGGIWQSTTNYSANGAVDDTAGGAAILPFTPVSGTVYTLSSTATVSNIANDDLAALCLGFTNKNEAVWNTNTVAPGSANRFPNNANVPGIAYQWTINGLQQYLTGPSGGSVGTSSVAGVSFNQKTVLDTTGTDWVVSFYLNDTFQYSYTDVGNTILSTIDSVGVSNFGGRTAGSVDNFLLTQVPEPSAALLGGLSGLLLLARRRRV